MARYTDIMRKREENIAELIEIISKKSANFTKPKMILIGGYALRAFVPFSRFTRDCDFVIKKKNGWNLDEIRNWLPKDVVVESFEKKNHYGFMRVMKVFRIDKGVRISLDFMEGQIVGRSEKQVVVIDEKFVENSLSVKIVIGGKKLDVFVPSYEDYFILKVVSSRPSDVRDIVTLVWKNGIPKGLNKRIKEILVYNQIFKENVEKVIIPTVSDKRFLDSWRGTFLTTEFTEDIKMSVLKTLRNLL